jgi:hypothetical protein
MLLLRTGDYGTFPTPNPQISNPRTPRFERKVKVRLLASNNGTWLNSRDCVVQRKSLADLLGRAPFLRHCLSFSHPKISIHVSSAWIRGYFANPLTTACGDSSPIFVGRYQFLPHHHSILLYLSSALICLDFKPSHSLYFASFHHKSRPTICWLGIPARCPSK